MSNSLVKGNLSIRAIHTFFNAIKQNLKLEQNNTKKCQKALKNAHF